MIEASDQTNDRAMFDVVSSMVQNIEANFDTLMSIKLQFKSFW